MAVNLTSLARQSAQVYYIVPNLIDQDIFLQKTHILSLLLKALDFTHMHCTSTCLDKDTNLTWYLYSWQRMIHQNHQRSVGSHHTLHGRGYIDHPDTAILHNLAQNTGDVWLMAALKTQREPGHYNHYFVQLNRNPMYIDFKFSGIFSQVPLAVDHHPI